MKEAKIVAQLTSIYILRPSITRPKAIRIRTIQPSNVFGRKPAPKIEAAGKRFRLAETSTKA